MFHEIRKQCITQNIKFCSGNYYIKGLDKEISQFVKGVVLMLCDKFVKDESLNKTISNLVGGNMKIVEDYAQRKVDESKRNFVINLDKKGFSIEDIAETAEVSIDFVKKTLSSSGNMKIVEDYAQRKADEREEKINEKFIINLDKKSFSIEEIAETVEVNLDFVKKTLSK